MNNNMSNQVASPFSGNQITRPQQANAMIESESQRSIAEVQAAMAIAKRFPRDEVAAMDRIINSCQRATLAKTAMYQYPRGGQQVSGPSIRLAEAMAQHWGNIQYGIRELSQNNGESTVEAFAWDIETNTKQVKVFQVPHVRHTRSGVTKLTDPRDVYETVANNGARRLRACILGVIPGDVIDAAVRQCQLTIQAQADTSPDGIKMLLESFESIGVTKSMIEKRIKCRAEKMQPAQVVDLLNIGNGINSGYSSVSDFFDMPTETVTNTGLNDAIAKAASKIPEAVQ